MTFIENLWAILAKSYVAWLVYIGTAAQIVFEFGFNTQLPGWVVVLLLVLILIGRTVKQESLSGPAGNALEFQGENGDSV